MPANNIRILNDVELHTLNSKYSFKYEGGVILVSTSNYSKITAHTLDKKFYLNTKIGKMTITVEAIKQWVENFKDKYSLIDVQNAINTLIVTYQQHTTSEIEAQIKSNRRT